jgi:hypothetical protein
LAHPGPSKEEIMKRNVRVILSLAALALLAGVPAVAADRVITNGIDPWVTIAEGKTFADFSNQAIPAGFFCAFSEPFSGRINLRGRPLVTGEPGALGNTDTIVQRLDDAVFNRRGVATTRIQMKALRLESEAPFQTACGPYNVYMSLNGEQPITRMKIIRTSARGGRFEAPVALNVKITFQPVGGELGRRASAPLELTQSVTFAPDPKALWSYRRGPTSIRKAGFVSVDTDGDLVADTYLPGTSNFVAGQAFNRAKCEGCLVDHSCHLITSEGTGSKN